MKATDLSIGDIGKTFRSLTYPNNNKTAKPNAHYKGLDLKRNCVVWERRPSEWKLETLYAHENGNIKINNYFHLRADTEIEEVKEND